MPGPLWVDEFVGYAVHKLRQNHAQIVRAARALDERQLWQRATPRCNSVGNLILHLTGNVRQWIIGGVGQTPIERDRAAEFAATGPAPLDPILAALERVVGDACGVIAALDADALQARREIQGYDVAVLVAVTHVVEHFSWHVGQIVHMAKSQCDVDLSV